MNKISTIKVVCKKKYGCNMWFIKQNHFAEEMFTSSMKRMIEFYLNYKKVKRIIIKFSKSEFPNSEKLVLEGEPELYAINYKDESSQMKGWICRKSLKFYFGEVPEVIYFSIEKYKLIPFDFKKLFNKLNPFK